jgi:hypothetical protein
MSGISSGSGSKPIARLNACDVNVIFGAQPLLFLFFATPNPTHSAQTLTKFVSAPKLKILNPLTSRVLAVTLRASMVRRA